MTKLIAEIGINHQGKLSKVKELIDHANRAGVYAIKFQYRQNYEKFFTKTLEMGSTLIKDELKNLFLTDEQYLKAFLYAKNMKMKVGVSFFREEDIDPFIKKFNFDFIKIPSSEALNFDLINKSKRACKSVMLSIGGASWDDINLIKKNIHFRKEDVVFYCVSNYPTAIDTVHFNYIKLIKKKLGCRVGYSSHDKCWEVCLASVMAGAEFIERHICFDKDQEGLDISSSSTVQEFYKLNLILSNQNWLKPVRLEKKKPNQGEIQNLKDLGSGYYYLSNYNKGEIINKDKVIIQSPCRGIRAGDTSLFGKKLNKSVIEGAPLIKEDYSYQKYFHSSNKIIFKNKTKFNFGLPIRFSDMQNILEKFELPCFEFHMSYKDVGIIKKLKKPFWNKIKESRALFSIHLPDYISNKNLIDPLDKKNNDIYNESKLIIDSCVKFAQKIEDETSTVCPIVGSFSKIHSNKKNTYFMLAELVQKFSKNSGGIMPQFLPKRAWYFGGAVELNLFCSIEDKKYYSFFLNGLCLDTAHLIMACNSAEGNIKNWFIEMIPFSKHLHLSDAIGIDGEGVSLGEGELDLNILQKFPKGVRIIVEQWEGHLYNFLGFKKAINYIQRVI